MSKLSRRSLLSSAAVVGIAGLSPLQVLAAMPGEIPSGTSGEALSDHAKVKFPSLAKIYGNAPTTVDSSTAPGVSRAGSNTR